MHVGMHYPLPQAKSEFAVGYPLRENSHRDETFKAILVENHRKEVNEKQNLVCIPLHQLVLLFFKILTQRKKHKRMLPKLITFAQITSPIKSVQKYYLQGFGHILAMYANVRIVNYRPNLVHSTHTSITNGRLGVKKITHIIWASNTYYFKTS